MIVLDTHIWHWWINQIPDKLPPTIIELIEQTDDDVAVSAISCFEMAWLVRHGRIDLGCHFDQWFEDVEASQCVRFLPVTPRIANLAPVVLPKHHKDPQDRLIIATTLVHDAQLLSFDSAFPVYQELQGRLIGRNRTAEKNGDFVIIAGQSWPSKISRQRDNLIARINKDGFSQTLEAVAYT